MDTFKKKTCKYCGASWRQNTSLFFTFPHCEGERQARMKKALKNKGFDVKNIDVIIGIDPASKDGDKTAISYKDKEGKVGVITF